MECDKPFIGVKIAGGPAPGFRKGLIDKKVGWKYSDTKKC